SSKRDQPSEPGQQCQRERADAGQQYLIDEVEQERSGYEGQRNESGNDPCKASPPLPRTAKFFGILMTLRHLQTRSSCSRLPNSPQGRIARTIKSTTNGTTSERSGLTYWIAAISADATIRAPHAAPKRLSSPPTKAAGNAFSPIVAIV